MASKDQRTIEPSDAFESWDRARTILLESLHKPDHHLRSCAHNQHCHDDMIMLRDELIEYVRGMSNPHKYAIEQRPEPTVNSDGSRSYEYAAHVTLTDIAKFQRGSSL